MVHNFAWNFCFLNYNVSRLHNNRVLLSVENRIKQKAVGTHEERIQVAIPLSTLNTRLNEYLIIMYTHT